MTLLQQFFANINVMVLALIIVGGIAATRFLSKWKWDGALKTLLVGSIFVGIYILIRYMNGEFHKTDLESYFVTYCFTTSLYELILKYFMDAIQGFFGDKKDGATYIKPEGK